MKAYLSWSEMGCWNRNRNEHYRRYILGQEDEPTMEMRLGSCIHAILEDPRKAKSGLQAIREIYLETEYRVLRRLIYRALQLRIGQPEVPITATTPQEIRLFMIADCLDKKERILQDWKTTTHDFIWTQRKIDTYDQFSFYAYIYKLVYHKYLKEILIPVLNTRTGSVKVMRTARGPKDLDYIEDKIHKCVNEMIKEGVWLKRLSKKEIKKKRNGELNLVYAAKL